MVAEQVLQFTDKFTECLERKDRILRELIQLICSCRIDTKSLMQVTPDHGDKASVLGWKWSFLIAVQTISKPLYEGLKKIEDDMNQDFRKSRLSIEDLELSDQAYTVLALLCKDEACAYVRSAEDGNGYQAWQALLRARTARNATNFLNQLLEAHSRHQTQESIFDNGTKMLRSTGHEPVNA